MSHFHDFFIQTKNKPRNSIYHAKFKIRYKFTKHMRPQPYLKIFTKKFMSGSLWHTFLCKFGVSCCYIKRVCIATDSCQISWNYAIRHDKLNCGGGDLFIIIILLLFEKYEKLLIFNDDR